MARRRKKAKPPVKVDHLSALPDEVLHQIMARGRMRAWEVARTCILSRRWRRVWASAPCVDLRVHCNGTHRPPPENFRRFVGNFLSKRDRRVSLHTLRLLHVPTHCDHEMDDDDDEHEKPTYKASDVARWVTGAIRRHRARVIEVTDHPEHPDCFLVNDVSFASAHLQQLKLWHARLGGNTLEDVSFRCPRLQVLELKDCILEGSCTTIASDSLTSLTMDKCRIWLDDLSVAAPNLVSLRCVKPFNRAPSFGAAMGSLSTATIILVDSFLKIENFDMCEEHADYKLGLSYSGENASYLYDDFYDGSDANSISTCQYGELADDDEQSSADSEDRSKTAGNYSGFGAHHGPPISGGDNLLLSLSNATRLDLIANIGEVILNRELETCPTFSNLKTLFLGEWCMADGFGPLLSFLDHCPILETLSIELKSDKDRAVAKPGDNGQLTGSLLACAYLTKVKIIKCCEDDVRVDALVRLFVDSGMDIKQILVRQTRKSCLLTSSTEVAL